MRLLPLPRHSRDLPCRSVTMGAVGRQADPDPPSFSPPSPEARRGARPTLRGRRPSRQLYGGPQHSLRTGQSITDAGTHAHDSRGRGWKPDSTDFTPKS